MVIVKNTMKTTKKKYKKIKTAKYSNFMCIYLFYLQL